MEIWRDIPGYEGHYQASDQGRVKSIKFNKELIMSPIVDKHGYFSVSLSLYNSRKRLAIHQLVAMAFLGHKPCGFKLVVDHINNNSKDNRACNLQLISQRENSSKDRKGTSKYQGVSWYTKKQKWIAKIGVKKKSIHIGCFNTELEASEAYKNKLKEINKKPPST